MLIANLQLVFLQLRALVICFYYYTCSTVTRHDACCIGVMWVNGQLMTF